jgi:uncharacterized membrane protein YphA (DoxX/SURF4 family)
MALSRRIARPLLASIFVVGGWDAFWNPASKAKKAEVVTESLVEAAGAEGVDTETLVRLNGAVQIGAGALLALGKFRRVAALALIGSIVPTTYAGHRFWEEEDPTTRSQQKMHFLKNIGLLGGLILAAFDTEGQPSLAWRAKRQARQIESSMTAGQAQRRRRVLRAGRQLGATALVLAEKATPDPTTLSHAQDVVADAVKGSAETAGHAVHHATSLVSDKARYLEPLARNGTRPTVDALRPHVASGLDRTAESLSKLREHLSVD